MADLLKILPFILGAAVSPVLLVTTIYLLSLPKKPIKKSLLYLLGSTLTIALITFLIFFTTNYNPRPAPNNDLLPHVIIGALLLFLAYSIYRKGPSKADKKQIKETSGIKFIILGAFLMLVNFTTIAMIFEVAIELRANQIVGAEKVAYMAATVVASIVPILVPLLVLLLAGKHSKLILADLSKFMSKYSHLVTAIFFAVLGAFCILKPFI